MQFYLVVEGHGDIKAAPVLMKRLSDFMLRGQKLAWGADAILRVGSPFCGAKLKSNAKEIIQTTANKLRQRPDCSGCLFLFDDEDGCSKKDAQAIAVWIKECRLPFPCAVVLAVKEYEACFLPSLSTLPGVKLKNLDAAAYMRRDPKAVLSDCMPKGKPYKEMRHQKLFSEKIDFNLVEKANLRSFNRLKHAILELANATSPIVTP
jgi:hypothetical protein